MSWSISEILKLFKKLSAVYQKLEAKPTVFKPDNTLLLILEKVRNKINNDPQWLLIIATHCFEEPQLLLLDMHLWCYHHMFVCVCRVPQPYKLNKHR